MRIFRIKVAAFLIALFALAVGPFLGTAAAAGKIALVTDLGGRGDLSFNDMGCKGADEASAAFGMELVGIKLRSRTSFQVTYMATFFSYDQSTLKLACISSIYSKIS